jgi:hypothetical protein
MKASAKLVADENAWSTRPQEMAIEFRPGR